MARYELGRPAEDEYDPYYHGYVGRVDNDDVLEALADHPEKVPELLLGLTEEQGSFSLRTRQMERQTSRRAYARYGKGSSLTERSASPAGRASHCQASTRTTMWLEADSIRGRLEVSGQNTSRSDPQA